MLDPRVSLLLRLPSSALLWGSRQLMESCRCAQTQSAFVFFVCLCLRLPSSLWGSRKLKENCLLCSIPECAVFFVYLLLRPPTFSSACVVIYIRLRLSLWWCQGVSTLTVCGVLRCTSKSICCVVMSSNN